MKPMTAHFIDFSVVNYHQSSLRFTQKVRSKKAYAKPKSVNYTQIQARNRQIAVELDNICKNNCSKMAPQWIKIIYPYERNHLLQKHSIQI